MTHNINSTIPDRSRPGLTTTAHTINVCQGGCVNSDNVLNTILANATSASKIVTKTSTIKNNTNGIKGGNIR